MERQRINKGLEEEDSTPTPFTQKIFSLKFLIFVFLILILSLLLHFILITDEYVLNFIL
jgi:hypothetical protein